MSRAKDTKKVKIRVTVAGKEPSTVPLVAWQQRRRFNAGITRQMRELLKASNSEFIGINWEVDLRRNIDVAKFGLMADKLAQNRVLRNNIEEIAKENLQIKSAPLPEHAAKRVVAKLPAELNARIQRLPYDLDITPADPNEIKSGVFYIEGDPVNDQIKYKVKDPDGKIIEGSITTAELKALSRNIPSAMSTKAEQLAMLEPLLPEILVITAKRKHTTPAPSIPRCQIIIQNVKALNDVNKIIFDQIIDQFSVGKIKEETTHPLERTDQVIGGVRDTVQAAARIPIKAMHVVEKFAGPGFGIIEQQMAVLLLIIQVYEQTLTVEEGASHALRITEGSVDLLRTFAPGIINTAFKKTPFGSIFTLIRQIVSEIFFATRWQAGRDKQDEAKFNMGERIKYFANFYEMIREPLRAEIEKEMKELKATQDPQKRQELKQHILKMRSKMLEAKTATENLINQTRREGARLNVEQQVLMTHKHISRIVNAVMIGLGIGAVFIPPLAIALAGIALTKSLVEKKLVERIKKNVELVQGIYDIDNNVVLDNGNNKKAFAKMRGVKEINLQYAAPTVIAFKGGLTTNRIYLNNAKQIRQHSQYTLYIADSLKYEKLDSYAKRSTIRGQIDAYSNTCRELLFHLGVILGEEGTRQPPGSDAYSFGNHRPPDINNIDEYYQMIDEWSENLLQQIRDQQLNPQSGKNSYFSEEQMSTIAKFRLRAKRAITEYKALRDKPPEEAPKDEEFIKKMYDEIITEIDKLNDALDKKVGDQEIMNGDALLLNLQKRIELFTQRCSDSYEHILWIADLNEKKNELRERFAKKIPHKKVLSPIKIIGVRPSAGKSITVAIHHYRPFQSRTAVHQLFSHHIARQAMDKEKAELHFTTVDTVTPAVIYKASYSKNILIIRGISRALEFIEDTIEGKTTQGANVTLANIKEVLDDYAAQLKIIKGGHKHLGKLQGKMIDYQIDKALKKIKELDDKFRDQETEAREIKAEKK